ncbi:MAG: DoxX family membrane protein [Dehalococcoidia bacterium]|nr:DoxX family membrane protein [Dehalococcoidia bacterium]
MTPPNLDLSPKTLRRLPFLQTGPGRRALDRYDGLDQAIVRLLDRHGIRLLRWALAAVFVWFGVLKIIDRSPVANLVAETVYWLPADVFVPALGVVEVLIGLGLLFGVGLRLVFAVFFLQMAGTFLVLILHPGESFQDGNPVLLTTLGEFVIKNLVLIAAGIVVASTVRERERARPEGLKEL